MNDINTQKRLREAEQERAEANKILREAAAQADCECQELAGQGVAMMRKAITGGCRESITQMGKAVPQLPPKEVVHMMLVTQYLDTLKDFASSSKGALMVQG